MVFIYYIVGKYAILDAAIAVGDLISCPHVIMSCALVYCFQVCLVMSLVLSIYSPHVSIVFWSIFILLLVSLVHV